MENMIRILFKNIKVLLIKILVKMGNLLFIKLNLKTKVRLI